MRLPTQPKVVQRLGSIELGGSVVRFLFERARGGFERFEQIS
jgi:hypothetical protein